VQSVMNTALAPLSIAFSIKRVMHTKLPSSARGLLNLTDCRGVAGCAPPHPTKADSVVTPVLPKVFPFEHTHLGEAHRFAT
jgi:hypothetical protein